MRVLIVEDQGLFRDMLASVLSTQPDIEVVGSASDGRTAIRLAEELAPDVVLMDIDLGSPPNGIEAGHTIRNTSPAIGIVILSMHRDKQYLASLPTDRAAGWSYLLKQNLKDVSALVRAIQGSAAGLVVMDPTVVQELRPQEGSELSRLTPRQLDVLRLIAQGYVNTAIAEKLVVSVKSVENLINGLFQELELLSDGPVHPRVMAVLKYLECTRSGPP